MSSNDTQFTDDIVCPYCFYHHEPNDIYEQQGFVCSGCDRTFLVQPHYEITYCTGEWDKEKCE